MGSKQYPKKSRQQLGKVNSPLNKKLKKVEWGEYRIGDLFEKIKVKSLGYKTSELPDEVSDNYVLPALTAGIQNQGLNNYVPRENATIIKRAISISANGANTGVTFYQNKEFTVLQDAYAIQWKNIKEILSDNHYLFLASSISKAIYGNYEWTNKAGWERIKTETIQLPTKSNKIDFDFMEKFIAELEAYLLATGLKDYQLTAEEQQALDEYDKVMWGEYRIGDLFEIEKTLSFNKDKLTIGKEYDYVTRTSLNQGVLKKTGFVNEENINPSGNWSLGLL